MGENTLLIGIIGVSNQRLGSFEQFY
jgi:hypothetical protein